jgi:DNA-binding transcriptional LysR family regulator
MRTVHTAPTLVQLDLNLFRVFDVVHRERSLSRAAVALSLTQSAVSHALGRLRDQLDDPLFVRQGRGVAPTPLAVRLAPAVREALAGLERALVDRRAFEPARDLRRVAIGVPSELEALLLPPLVARLLEASAEAQVTAVPLDRPRLRADLAASRIDLAFDVAQPVHADVAHERVFDDTFCVVASKKWRALDRAAYLEASHVAVSSRAAGTPLEDVRFATEGVQRKVAVRCQRYETACQLVAESNLLLTMPRHRAELQSQRLPLKLFDPPLRIPRVRVHLYWLRQHEEHPAHKWLHAQVREVIAALA